MREREVEAKAIIASWSRLEGQHAPNTHLSDEGRVFESVSRLNSSVSLESRESCVCIEGSRDKSGRGFSSLSCGVCMCGQG